MPEKLKLKIIKVEDEETPDGTLSYKMTLQSKMGTYIRGATVSDWEDERKQRSIKKTWRRDIDKIEAAKKKSESKTEEELRTELKVKIKDIEGTELEEDE
jgi:hypothetical protein